MTTTQPTRHRHRCRAHTTAANPRYRPRTTAPPTPNQRRAACVSRTTNDTPATTPETVPVGVEWLTTNQAAAYLQVPARQLQQWRYLKKGPPYSLAGRAVRYRHADLDAWLTARRVEPDETRR